MEYVLLAVFLVISGTEIHASHKAEERKALEVQQIKAAAAQKKALKKKAVHVAQAPLKVDGIELADLGRRDYA